MSGEGVFVIPVEVIDGSFYLANGPGWNMKGCDSTPVCGGE